MNRIKKLLIITFIIIMIVFVGCKHKEDDNFNKMVQNGLSLPKDYPSEVAIEKGDVVNVHGKVTNIEELDKFMEDVNDGKEAFVRITSYTIEGDPIIYVLYNDGKYIEYYEDNTRDRFGEPKVKRSDYLTIEVGDMTGDEINTRNYYISDKERKDLLLVQVLSP